MVWKGRVRTKTRPTSAPSARDAENRDRLWIATHEDDRQAFSALIRDLDGPLLRDARGFVRPSRARELVAATWVRAWKNRRSYDGDPSPLAWLHRMMCIAVFEMALAPVIDVKAAREELADLESRDGVAEVLTADSVDDLLDRLDMHQSVLFRRVAVLGPNWAAIAEELGYPSPRRTKKSYEIVKKAYRTLSGAEPATGKEAVTTVEDLD